MENLEKLAQEVSLTSGGVDNEGLFDNVNQDLDEKSSRPTENDGEEITQSAGSENLGKFKDAESLLKAYNSLQAEFTKKSQRLSELESEMKPLARLDMINTTIDEIFQEYSITKPLKEKLRDNLVNIDGEVSKQLAEQTLLKLLADNYVTPQELVKDKEFLSNHIFNNNEIKDAIVKDYLEKLKSVPNIKVATNFNSSVIATPPNKVKTIKEAGSIARSIIKKS